MKRLVTTLLLTPLLVLLSFSTARGDIVLTHLGGTNYQMTLDPIAFLNINAPTGGQLTGVVIEDFFASDAVFSGVAVSGVGTYSVNAGVNQDANISGVNGTLGVTFNALDKNDLFIQTVAFGALSGGENIAFSSLNAVFTSPFVPPQSLANSFTVSLVDFSTYNAVATTTVNAGNAIPEPSSFVILATALLAASVSIRRRRPIVGSIANFA